MKISFDGAAQTVTGTQHLLEINGRYLLLDCGLFQGKRQESYERNRNLPFDPHSLDAVILSHAHIDHCGNLPNLVKNGFRKSIYATEATAHLANVTLMDSGHIQEMDAAYATKRNALRGEAPAKPLYTMEDAARVAQFFDSQDYEEAFQPIPGVVARFVDAGHILGSAAVVLDINENGRKFRVWFSGDIGRRGLPLLRDPVLPDGADYLIMESTYGDKPHRDPQAAYEELRDVTLRTLKRGGKVIIPAFAIGRTQELVYDFHKMFESRAIPRVAIFVDSPLAVNVTDVFKAHPECFDQETQDFIRHDRHHEALGFDLLTYTRSVEESKALNNRQDPMIIISASGMAENGRILHHLRNNIGNPRNTILIVGWQAPDTLGRRLAERQPFVKIFGEEFERKAEVATIGGLSAHAGQDFLVEYAAATQGTLKQIYLVHGEPAAAGALKAKMAEKGSGPGCSILSGAKPSKSSPFACKLTFHRVLLEGGRNEEKHSNPGNALWLCGWYRRRGLLFSIPPSAPQHERQPAFEVGWKDPVEILRDQWGVPHIYADSEHDLFFAQGFIHAEERLWQMEFNRRLVAGRVSEILGPVSIQLDRWMRTIGMRQVAEQEAARMSGEAADMLQAYADGVNARLAQGRFPIELNLLRFRPEPWIAADSLAWSKMMAWTLSVNWEAEILRAMLIEKLGPEKAAELEPGYFDEWPLIIPKGVDYSAIGAEALKKAAAARRMSGPGAVSGIGSNNWVIGWQPYQQRQTAVGQRYAPRSDCTFDLD